MGDLLGNALSDAEFFPARGYDICSAVHEALKQALGLGPFDFVAITPTTTDEELEGRGAPAAGVVKLARSSAVPD